MWAFFQQNITSVITWGIIIVGWFVARSFSKSLSAKQIWNSDLSGLCTSMIENVQHALRMSNKYWLTTDGGTNRSQLLEIEIISIFTRLSLLSDDLKLYDKKNVLNDSVSDAILLFKISSTGDKFEDKARKALDRDDKKISDITDTANTLIDRIKTAKDSLLK